MTFYHFRQNNSGGVFERPAINVYVEASDATEATMLAEVHGLYFDDKYFIDCECCRQRWSPVSEWDAVDEPAEPTEYEVSYAEEDGVEAIKVIRKNKEA